MTSINDRIERLRSAVQDYEYMLRSADAFERRAITEKLARIRRQIAMLTEESRQPMAMPEQARRFK